MLSRILDDTRKQLVQDLRQKLGELRVALVRAEATEEGQKAVGRAIGQLDELFLLVVVGEFNAGKSAVINALVGERVLEEGPTPTTSRIQLLKHGLERTRTPAGGDYETITLPVAILREMSVVDTPGTNAVVRGHEALTREFVPRSDLVLFVTSADRPFTETERTFLESIRDWGKKLVVAVNKTDILEKPDDVRKVVEFVRDNLRELLGLRPEVFAVSARQAWKTKAAGVAPDPLTTGFGALETYLTRTLDDAERLRVKLQGSLGVAERAVDGASDAAKSRLVVVTEDEAVLKEIESLLLQQLQDQTRDFRLRLSEAERPLVELEKRGDEWLDQTLRVTGALGLLDAERTAAGFRHGGHSRAADRRRQARRGRRGRARRRRGAALAGARRAPGAAPRGPRRAPARSARDGAGAGSLAAATGALARLPPGARGLRRGGLRRAAGLGRARGGVDHAAAAGGGCRRRRAGRDAGGDRDGRRGRRTGHGRARSRGTPAPAAAAPQAEGAARGSRRVGAPAARGGPAHGLRARAGREPEAGAGGDSALRPLRARRERRGCGGRRTSSAARRKDLDALRTRIASLR